MNMKVSGTRGSGRGARIAVTALVCLTACGNVQSEAGHPGGPGTTPTIDPPTPTTDPLGSVPCEPWHPSDADWSSLPTSRPARVGSLTASPSGKYLYAVGSWVDEGVVNNQILRSASLGETWCVLPTPEAIAQVAPSPASETILYALTRAAAGQPPSLLVTKDGGATWNAPLPSLPSAPSGPLYTSFTDPSTVWLKGAYMLVGNPWLVSRDGGATWTTPTPPELAASSDLASLDTPYAFIAGLVVDPNTPDRLLEWGTVQTLEMWESGSTPDRWFSSEDGGSTWRELDAPPARPASVLTGVSEPMLVDRGSKLYLQTDAGLLRSDDWGETWRPLDPLPEESTNLTTLGSGKTGHLFAVSSRSPVRGEVQPRLWNSSNNGSTWQVVPLPSDPDFAPLLSPDGGDVIVGLSNLGMLTTADHGKHWLQHGIIPAPSSLAQSPAAWQRLWATGLITNEGGSKGAVAMGVSPAGSAALQSVDGGLNWTPISDVDGPLYMDGASADVALSGPNDSGNLGQRTEDGGQTWEPFTLPRNGYIGRVAVCPAPASCAYLIVQDRLGVGCRLARTDDRGRSWNETAVPFELCSGSPTLAISPDDPNHLVAACSSSICLSRDRGVTWTTAQRIGPNSDYYVTALAFLQDDVVLAVTTTGYAVDTLPPVLARSTDGGVTWDKLREITGRAFKVSSVRPRTVFMIGSAVNEPAAVYRSDDAGATWALFPPSAGAALGGSTSFSSYSISDRVGGGFIAATSLGLLQFN